MYKIMVVLQTLFTCQILNDTLISLLGNIDQITIVKSTIGILLGVKM